jgi:Chaperone of endosialidase
MASTYSPLLRFELIGSGDQAGLWGTTTNGNLGALVEQSVAGVASIVLSSSADYTLQSLNGTPDEARCAVLSFSGAPGGATNIIIPTSQKLYVVRNSTGQTLTVKTSAQVGGVTILDANATLVFCNGINALAGFQSSSTANVTGPASSTDNAIARYDGTTGQLLQNSAATIDDNGASSFVGTVTVAAQSSTVGGQVSLRESSAQGTNTVALRAPASIATDVTLTLPDTAGSASQVLTTNGSGTLSWTTPVVGAVTSVNGLTGAVTVTPSLIGAPTTSGSGASGTWGINISGNSSSATYATYATYDSSGYGIVNTSTNQSIGGTKTFTGSSNFGGPGTYINIYGQLQCITPLAGAGFGVANPNGAYALYAAPALGTVGYAGIVTQSNGGNNGLLCATQSTGTSLIALFYGAVGSATPVGSISTDGTNTGYNSFSDYRLKENIAPLSDAVARLKLLKPVDFTWKSAPEKGVTEGFIAHELQEVLPNAVHGDKDQVDEEGKPKYQGVDASFIVPLLTAALQEALARIEALEAKVG